MQRDGLLMELPLGPDDIFRNCNGPTKSATLQGESVGTLLKGLELKAWKERNQKNKEQENKNKKQNIIKELEKQNEVNRSCLSAHIQLFMF